MIHPLWCICIVVRLLLVFSILKYTQYYKYLKLIVLAIGLGFLYKSLTGSNNEIQFSKVFWHKTRIIHSLLYLLAFSMFKPINTAIILMCDIIFSILYREYLETIKYKNN